MKIHTGDTVKVMLGKDNGKTAKVLRVLAKEGKAVVEGVNVSKRHIRRTAQNEGGVFEVVKPVNISNLMIVCPNCKKATRIGYQIENGNKIRICKKCKKELTEKKEKAK